MGTTNFGTQEITYRYKQKAESEDFNKINYKLVEPGIYDWTDKDSGTPPLTRVTNDSVEVAPMTFFITDAVTGNAVRIETSAATQLSINSSAPFVIWRYSWSSVETWYADLLVSDFVSIQSTDLIVGRAVFSGTTLEEDLAELEKKDLHYRKMFALVYRSENKKILENQIKLMNIAKIIIEKKAMGVEDSEKLIEVEETPETFEFNRFALRKYLAEMNKNMKTQV